MIILKLFCKLSELDGGSKYGDFCVLRLLKFRGMNEIEDEKAGLKSWFGCV